MDAIYLLENEFQSADKGNINERPKKLKMDSKKINSKINELFLNKTI